jgi:hypothetical protein
MTGSKLKADGGRLMALKRRQKCSEGTVTGLAWPMKVDTAKPAARSDSA